LKDIQRSVLDKSNPYQPNEYNFDQINSDIEEIKKLTKSDLFHKSLVDEGDEAMEKEEDDYVS